MKFRQSSDGSGQAAASLTPFQSALVVLVGLVCGILVGTALMETAGVRRSQLAQKLAQARSRRLGYTPPSAEAQRSLTAATCALADSLTLAALRADQMWSIGAAQHPHAIGAAAGAARR